MVKPYLATCESERMLSIFLNKYSIHFLTTLLIPIQWSKTDPRYTQKMLLDEFAEAGHGSDKMDFFYLPIDFKNKCNRGYAFVNFVDYRDIASFHHQYNGKHWKVFNSDKICDITYARIQGKAAMLNRFRNSTLLAQEEEYKPVSFVSSGPRKGEREELENTHSHPSSPQTSSLAAAAAAAGSGGRP